MRRSHPAYIASMVEALKKHWRHYTDLSILLRDAATVIEELEPRSSLRLADEPNSEDVDMDASTIISAIEIEKLEPARNAIVIQWRHKDGFQGAFQVECVYQHQAVALANLLHGLMHGEEQVISIRQMPPTK